MTKIAFVEHLTHRYGDHPALHDVSFEMQAGEIFGLIGPNGAGKTTSVRLMNGLFEPTDGKIRVLGLDPTRDGQQVRRKTGVLTETPALYERLTARQNLDFFGTLCEMPKSTRTARIQEILTFFELEERANDKVSTFSKGMKQRLALARALLHKPEILFLDEPTSALDPEASAQVRDLIASVSRRDGASVMLCTHILSEAQRLCDRVAILGKGELLALGTLSDLRQRVLPGLWLEVDLLGEMPPGLEARLVGIRGIQAVKVDGGSVHLHIDAQDVVPTVASTVISAGGRLLRLQPVEISLEEIYFTLQNNQSGDSHENR